MGRLLLANAGHLFRHVGCLTLSYRVCPAWPPGRGSLCQGQGIQVKSTLVGPADRDVLLRGMGRWRAGLPRLRFLFPFLCRGISVNSASRVRGGERGQDCDAGTSTPHMEEEIRSWEEVTPLSTSALHHHSQEGCVFVCVCVRHCTQKEPNPV